MRTLFLAVAAAAFLSAPTVFAKNPLFEHVFTADPAALADGDTLWLYTGHDEAPNNDVFFEMHDWLAFSTTDMKNWTEHGPIMRAACVRYGDCGSN
jgi:arabinoxylan arabinofuranohydrolase